PQVTCDVTTIARSVRYLRGRHRQSTTSADWPMSPRQYRGSPARPPRYLSPNPHPSSRCSNQEAPQSPAISFAGLGSQVILVTEEQLHFDQNAETPTTPPSELPMRLGADPAALLIQALPPVVAAVAWNVIQQQHRPAERCKPPGHGGPANRPPTAYRTRRHAGSSLGPPTRRPLLYCLTSWSATAIAGRILDMRDTVWASPIRPKA